MKNKSGLSRWLAGLVRNRLVLVGALILSLLVLAAVTAPLWVKTGLLRDPIQQFPTGLDEDGMPLKAGGQFFAGTDTLGRDVFSAVIVVAANLVVDVLYRWIDPRIKATA